MRDWTFNNRSYFEAVELEKRMMFIILTLIIAVAAFNLVSSLVMAVTEKQADIAILRTLGLSPGGVMKIFLGTGRFCGVLWYACWCRMRCIAGLECRQDCHVF